jgi:hypothetical protein
MWKTSVENMYVDNGMVATVMHQYIPTDTEPSGYFPPYLRRRVFTDREIAVEWMAKELLAFDPVVYEKEAQDSLMIGAGLSGPVGEA